MKYFVILLLVLCTYCNNYNNNKLPKEVNFLLGGDTYKKEEGCSMIILLLFYNDLDDKENAVPSLLLLNEMCKLPSHEG